MTKKPVSEAQPGGRNPCKTRPGQKRVLDYQFSYSSAEAADFANVPASTVYRAMRLERLPITATEPPRILHDDLIKWMIVRGFPVPQPRTPTAPTPITAPTAPPDEQWRVGEDVWCELERDSHSDFPVRIGVVGTCSDYAVDAYGWLANTDEAIEEAQVTTLLTLEEAEQLAHTLLGAVAKMRGTEAPALASASVPLSQPSAAPVLMPEGKLLSIQKAAARTGLPTSLVRRAMQQGWLPALNLAPPEADRQQLVAYEANVDAWRDSLQVTPAEPLSQETTTA